MAGQTDRTEIHKGATAQCRLYTHEADSPLGTSIYAACDNGVAQEDAFAWAAELLDQARPNHMLVEASIPVPPLLQMVRYLKQAL